MIYLLGINHRLQIKTNLNSTKVLLEFISTKIQKYSIEIIAEEFNKDSLWINGIKSTTIQRLAQKNIIHHLFIDPDLEKRRKLGIKRRTEIMKEEFNGDELFIPQGYKRFIDKVKSNFTPREEFWYEQIKDLTYRNILVICGADHLISFSELLERKGSECLIFEQIFD